MNIEITDNINSNNMESEKKLESLISCLTCRNKKVKCGRELPQCNYCLKRNLDCFYSNKSKRRNKMVYRLNLEVNENEQTAKKLKQIKKKYGISDVALNEAPLIVLKSVILQKTSHITTTIDNTQKFMFQQPYQQKLQTHLLLMLTTQVIKPDSAITEESYQFLKNLELGFYGIQVKLSIRFYNEWIQELFNPNLDTICINSYFDNFHQSAPYLSKYYFFRNNLINTNSNKSLLSVIKFVGYAYYSKQSPELLKYLKHLAITVLKKNFFKVSLSNCQALFIFSYYLVFQGLTKQSLVYFRQACQLASALGIHQDYYPGYDEALNHSRQCIRFTSFIQDVHMSSTLGMQSYYHYLIPKWTPLNPVYQSNPNSKDRYELLKAKCVCISLEFFTKYFTPATNLLIEYSMLNHNGLESLTYENFIIPIKILDTLYKESYINSLILYLELSESYCEPEGIKIIRAFVSMHLGLYHMLILILNTQFPPQLNQERELDLQTKKALYSANILTDLILNTDINATGSLPMLYNYLSSITLFYLKLCLNFKDLEVYYNEFKIKLNYVFDRFIVLQAKFNLPIDVIEMVEGLLLYYKIRLD